MGKGGYENYLPPIEKSDWSDCDSHGTMPWAKVVMKITYLQLRNLIGQTVTAMVQSTIIDTTPLCEHH